MLCVTKRSLDSQSSTIKQQIVVEIDVADNYAALSDLTYNRIILSEKTTNIIGIVAPLDWY